ncbi:MAG TPA: hypothetical protein VFT98_06910 [Myxococcota bacterium]|nr:hypothetical protein [Myxococcota bacterium]
MPRGPRLDAPGVAHHIWQRGAGRMDVFHDDADRLDFLTRFERLLEEEGQRAHGVVLLSNHFHAVLVTGPTPLWKFMHRLTTGYGRYFVERYAYAGHVFQNRYGSRVLESDEDVATCVVYAARNPLEAGLARSERALRVDYRWSSYPALMDPRATSYGIAVRSTLALFGRSVPEARADLRARVARGVAWKAEDDRAAHPPLSASDPLRAKTFEAIVAGVCRRFQLAASDVRGRSRDASARNARVEVARAAARAGFSGREISRELCVSEATACRMIRAVTRR